MSLSSRELKNTDGPRIKRGMIYGKAKRPEMVDGPEGVDRLPILDDKGHPKYIIHRSMIEQFVSKKARNPARSLWI